MKKNHLFVVVACLLLGCNRLEKEVAVVLPPYKSQLVVECYLEENVPYRLLLSSSTEYLAPLSDPTVKDAFVTISHEGQIDTLRYDPLFDIFTGKFYNYRSDKVAVRNESPYQLYIKDGQGREIKGTTRFLPLPDLDTITWRFREPDTAALLQINLNDIDEKVENYYRILGNVDSLYNRSDIDYLISDRGFAGKIRPVVSNYRYKYGDTLNLRIFHIEESYYRFLDSRRDVQRANGNPFAQPATLKSTVSGGIGVFTALNYHKRTVILK
jgi:hypothetical protein